MFRHATQEPRDAVDDSTVRRHDVAAGVVQDHRIFELVGKVFGIVSRDHTVGLADDVQRWHREPAPIEVGVLRCIVLETANHDSEIEMDRRPRLLLHPGEQSSERGALFTRRFLRKGERTNKQRVGSSSKCIPGRCASTMAPASGTTCDGPRAR